MSVKTFDEAKNKIDALRSNIKKVIIGNEKTIDLVITTLVAGGHVLLEDTPGTGKTTLAKVMASSIDGKFSRIQFTPDLLPADITGLNIYSQKEDAFTFVEGPIMTNILLADEINRATPRTQAALLEAMEERSVTVDGKSRELSKPFIVIATENPVETTGTFPLPEAQLDRFMVKLTMGDIGVEDEIKILERFVVESPEKEVKPVVKAEDIVEASNTIKKVTVNKAVMTYLVNLSDATRNSSKLFSGVSPRASLNLMRISQSFAAISGRDYVTPDDIRYLAPFVYSHRVITSSGITNLGETRGIIREIISSIEVPVEDWK